MTDYDKTKKVSRYVTGRFRKALENLAYDYEDEIVSKSLMEHKECKMAEYKNITLDVDELGIWLVDETEDEVMQMGHISWQEVTRGVQQALLQERFLIVLQKMGQEFDNE